MPNKFITEFNSNGGPVKTGYYPANKKSLEISISQGDDTIKLGANEVEYLIASLQAVKNVIPTMSMNEAEHPGELVGKPFETEWGLGAIK